MNMVNKLSLRCIVVKKISNETPIMMSGMIKGIYVVVHISFLNFLVPMYIATAPNVPKITPTKLELIPTMMEFINVRQTWADDVKSFSYHFKLTPVHTGDFEELNEKSTTTNMGM